MYKFEKEQETHSISSIKVGGQPGEYPTVLIGSIFYERHKIVSNPLDGEFDSKAAEDLIKKQEELCDRTGNPFIIDVVGSTSNALIRYLDFVSEISEYPFLIDGPSADVRMPAMKHAIEVGLRERAIYNSLDYHVSDTEISMLKELNVKSSILMAYNPRNVWPEGRLEILRGYESQKGLLEAAKQAGIPNLLVDTAVLDVPSIGHAAKAQYLVKTEYGLPVGCGPANAVTTWDRLRKEYAPSIYHCCLASSATINIMMGANFILYGPIEFAETIYPACAMTDAVVAYAARRLGTRPKVKNHPLFKIF